MKKTDEELKRIAVDLYDGKIFSDRHFRSLEETHSLISLVFLPLVFGALKSKEQFADLGLVYEYFDKAGPRAMNGYPMFTSCCFLDKVETKKMFGFFEEYKKLKEGFMGKKMLPCPSPCNTEVVLQDEGGFWVECPKCHLRLRQIDVTAENAIKAWNKKQS